MAFNTPLATNSTYGVIIPGTNLTTTNGVLDVVPIALLDQAFFYSTVTQTNPVASAINKVTFNNAAINVGITLVSSTQITVSKTANYNFQFTAQVNKTDGGLDQMDFWLMRNNANYPNTNTTLTLNGDNLPLMAGGWNYTLALTAGDYIEIAWQSADIGFRLLTNGTQVLPSRPVTTSARCTIIQM